MSRVASACKCLLELQRRDVAAHGAGQIARWTAQAGADIEDMTRRAQAEEVRSRVHRVRAMVVLVEGEQLRGRERLVNADTAPSARC